MSIITIICVAGFAALCGRLAYKAELFEKWFGSKPNERTTVVVMIAVGASLWFVYLGIDDNKQDHRKFFNEHCSKINGGYICKFKDSIDRDTGGNECHSRAPGAC